VTKSDLVAILSRCLAVVETDVVTLERWSMEPTLGFPERAAVSSTRARLVGHRAAREIALQAANHAGSAATPQLVKNLFSGTEGLLLALEAVSDAVAPLSASSLASPDLFNLSQMLELNANTAAHLAENILADALS
jgi:hypothetical protein